MEETILDLHVREIKALGEVLMPFNFPRVTPKEEEDVNFLKAREVNIDGYSLIVHYSKASYADHQLESLQILGKYIPFLPFCLVCKIAKRFLGDEHLSLAELFRDNRKIYCWIVARDSQGQSMDAPYEHQDQELVYEGLHFHAMQPGQLDFH